MRQIYVAILFLALAFGIKAQDIESNHPILDLNPNKLSFDVGSIILSNHTNSDYRVKLRQEIIDSPEGASLTICFGETCFPSSSANNHEYSESFSLPANGTNENLKVAYNSNGSNDSANWKLTLIDSSTGRDLYSFSVFYDSQLGIVDAYKLESEISLPTPNPIITEATLSYELPKGIREGHINVYNLTGSMVQQIELTENSGVTRIYAEGLEKGIYFYSLMVNEIALHTKRMVIAQ